MMERFILTSRQNELKSIIKHLYDESQPHSKGFACRILGEHYLRELGIVPTTYQSDQIKYGGFPEVSKLGYAICAVDNPVSTAISDFCEGIKRLEKRGNKNKPLSEDDIALLGLALGINTTIKFNPTLIKRETRDWLIELIESASSTEFWSYRTRLLAGDVLDKKRRLDLTYRNSSTDDKALEVVLRQIWQQYFEDVKPLPEDFLEDLFSELLQVIPDTIDLEKAVCRLKSLELIISQTSKSLLPKQSQEESATKKLLAVKGKLDQRAELQVKRMVWFGALFLLLYWIFLAYLTVTYTWDIMEPWITFLGAIGPIVAYIFFAIKSKEFSPTTIYAQILYTRKLALYKRAGLDLSFLKEKY